MFPMNFLRWSGSHIRWGQPFRLRHITTGKYLSLLDDKSLLLTDKEEADVKSTAFCFRSSKVWNQCSINITSSNSSIFRKQDLDISYCMNYRSLLPFHWLKKMPSVEFISRKLLLSYFCWVILLGCLFV